MGIFINIMILVLAFVDLIIASGYISNSTRLITDIPSYSSNAKLTSAHHYGTIASVIGWLTVVALLIIGGLYLFFGLETAEFTGSIFVYGILFITLIAIIAVGVLAAIAAGDIGSAKVTDNKGSYRGMIIGAILGIVGFVLVLTVLILKFTYKPKNKTTNDTMFGNLFGNKPALPDFLTQELNSDPQLAEALV